MRFELNILIQLPWYEVLVATQRTWLSVEALFCTK